MRTRAASCVCFRPRHPGHGTFAQGLGLAIAGTRASLGVVALAVPGAVARPWIGEASRGPLAAVLGRALGGRDLALGLGALAARREPVELRRWLMAGALADAGDVAVTLAAFGGLPSRGRIAVLLAAGGGLLGGAVAAAGLPVRPQRLGRLRRRRR